VIRYEFIDTSILEEDIHPDIISDKERELARAFVTNLKLSQEVQPCPICEAARTEILFDKWGCRYAICPKTWTVSLATFPDEEILHNYCFHSELSIFRSSKEYQIVVSKRRKDLWENQIGWIEGRVSRHLGIEQYVVVDWGSRATGWIEYLKTASFVDTLSVLEPLPPIHESPDIEERVDIVCLIDVLQRETQPNKLLYRISEKLKTGGLLIVCNRAGSGFDVLTLRERSESIFPLDHILLPSPNGMQILLEQSGFDVLEITTPGVLDMKYVQNAGKNIPKDQYFLRFILEQGDEFLLERMQGFLQQNNLSSHLRCIAKKR